MVVLLVVVLMVVFFPFYITKLASDTCNYFYFQPAQYKVIQLNKITCRWFPNRTAMLNGANLLMEIIKAAWNPQSAGGILM